eukprot:6190316-Pleurochrysis_carterae.AAC.1
MGAEAASSPARARLTKVWCREHTNGFGAVLCSCASRAVVRARTHARLDSGLGWAGSPARKGRARGRSPTRPKAAVGREGGERSRRGEGWLSDGDEPKGGEGSNESGKQGQSCHNMRRSGICGATVVACVRLPACACARVSVRKCECVRARVHVCVCAVRRACARARARARARVRVRRVRVRVRVCVRARVRVHVRARACGHRVRVRACVRARRRTE